MDDVNQTAAEREYARDQGFADYDPRSNSQSQPRKTRSFFQKGRDYLKRAKQRRQSRGY